MASKTVNEAIIEVLKESNKPLQPKDILQRIKEKGLYQFKTASPENIVRNQLRRHSENVKLQVSAQQKHFVSLDDGGYRLIKK